MNYVVVSPVKDEERNISRTLESMLDQTMKPLRWIIVDDGSRDRTADVVQSYAGSHSFVYLLRRDIRQARQTGIAEIVAFNEGYQLVREMAFDCVVKLDGDLSFNRDYFEQLLARFHENPKLGIASGTYMERRGNEWTQIKMPTYHAAGASKMVRKECFDAIGGFIPERGWDTVDEIRAMTIGWQTMHFPELRMEHWKPEGVGMGYLSTSYMHGEIYFRTGGGLVFLVPKVLSRFLHRPIITGGLALFCGYLHGMLRRAQRLVTPDEARCYRALLNRRLLTKFTSTAAESN